MSYEQVGLKLDALTKEIVRCATRTNTCVEKALAEFEDRPGDAYTDLFLFILCKGRLVFSHNTLAFFPPPVQIDAFKALDLVVAQTTLNDQARAFLDDRAHAFVQRLDERVMTFRKRLGEHITSRVAVEHFLSDLLPRGKPWFWSSLLNPVDEALRCCAKIQAAHEELNQMLLRAEASFSH